MPVNVLVVDDSAFMRKMISEMIESDPRLKVIATARDGIDALEKVRTLPVDVITLDVHMPRMDGLTFLEHLMREKPLPVVMVSSLTQEGSETTLEALALGAVDFVPKPSGAISLDIDKVKDELLRKVRAASRARVSSALAMRRRLERRRRSLGGLGTGDGDGAAGKPGLGAGADVGPSAATGPSAGAAPPTSTGPSTGVGRSTGVGPASTAGSSAAAGPSAASGPSATAGPSTATEGARTRVAPPFARAARGARSIVFGPPPTKAPLGGAPDIVVAMGASTGGPTALEEVLCALPPDLPAGVVITQHMQAGFTRSYAERLNNRCALTVREAQDGDELREGLVLIAPGDYHMVITPSKRVRLNQDPPVHYVRPSVDVMMLSVAAVFGSRVVGVVLTGMGRDGSGGMAAIKKAGGRTIVQDEETSVIFSMPAAVIAGGHADEVLPLDHIALRIVYHCMELRQTA